MKNIIIHDELKNLLPPLSPEEFAGLEKSILKDGCLSSLIVWDNILVDGHYRYDICRKHGIPFSVECVHFENLEGAKRWAWHHQKHRRNLTIFHHAEQTLKFMKGSTAREISRKETHEVSSAKKRGLLCKMAGVSTTTLQKIEFLMEHASPEVKERLRKGEKGTSIHREYMRLRPMEDQESLRLPFKQGKQNAGKWSAEELSKWLLSTRSTAYVRELILRILCDYRDRYGEDEAEVVYRYLSQSYDQK